MVFFLVLCFNSFLLMYNCEEMLSNKFIGFEVLKNVYDEVVE